MTLQNNYYSTTTVTSGNVPLVPPVPLPFVKNRQLSMIIVS